MSRTLQILFQNERLVAIDKPSGFHVHQPEFPARRAPPEKVCLGLLRRQISKYVYPVHRIDVATSGVLLFALDKQAASVLGGLITRNAFEKTYYAVVRGWTKDEEVIDLPLESDSSGELVEAITWYRSVARIELPYAVGKRHASARYSLIEARPHTGRFHQIRRHLARLSHPLIGDTSHGDSYHNRFFREELGIRGLLLKARHLALPYPEELRGDGEGAWSRLEIEAPWDRRWQSIFRLFEIEAP